MLKKIHDLGRGDVVLRVPFAGPEAFPVTVIDVVAARTKGYMILIGTDAADRRIQIPLGHSSGSVEVRA